MKISYDPFNIQIQENQKFTISISPESVSDLDCLREIFSRGFLKVDISPAKTESVNPGEPYNCLIFTKKP